MSRTLSISIFRHNPRDPASAPRMETHELAEAPGMTLFIALNRLRESVAPDLSFDFVCRAGVCGSCAMVINGRPGLACRTLTAALPERISLHPLPGFALNALFPIIAMDHIVRLEHAEIRNIVQRFLRNDVVYALQVFHHDLPLLICHMRQALVAGDGGIRQQPDGNPS